MPTSITSQKLIEGALQDLGRIAPGETPTVTMSTAAFVILNEIVSSWSRDGQITYNEKVGTKALTAGTDAYTIGVGGSFNTTDYPQKVKSARCSFAGFQGGVAVVPMADFDRVCDNPTGATAALIKVLGVDNAAPLRNARVFPVPNVATVVEITWWEPLAQLASLAATVAFPVDGWEAALRAELVIALCPSYGLEATTTMAGNLARFKARITDTGTSLPPQQQGQQQGQQGQ